MQNNQKYYEYSHGNYVSKQIQLNYSTISTQFKYNFHQFFKSGIFNANLVVGGYGGMLNYGKLKTESQTRNIKDHYKKYDIGFLVGYEFGISLFDHFVINPGIKYKQGVLNIYQGDGNIPASFNKTYPASIDFNLGISYILK
jgi:hypothetical protein